MHKPASPKTRVEGASLTMRPLRLLGRHLLNKCPLSFVYKEYLQEYKPSGLNLPNLIFFLFLHSNQLN